MDPWKIIGWIILALLALWALKKLLGSAWRLRIPVIRYWLHIKTRSIPPEEGQEWWQNGSVLRIGKRWPKGHFTIHSGSASWGETDNDWQERLKNRRLFLIKSNDQCLRTRP